MIDSYGRHLHYLRVSLTDACNLRCVYCMPEDIRFRPRLVLMQDDEMLTLVRVAASLGVDKIRLDRRGTDHPPRRRRPGAGDQGAFPGIEQVRDDDQRRQAGRTGRAAARRPGSAQVNISIDSLDPEKFRRITRRGDLDDVWRGIAAAEAAGLTADQAELRRDTRVQRRRGGGAGAAFAA